MWWESKPNHQTRSVWSVFNNIIMFLDRVYNLIRLNPNQQTLTYQYSCFCSHLYWMFFLRLPGSFIFMCLTHRHTNKHILQHIYSTVSWIMLSFFFFLKSVVDLSKRVSVTLVFLGRVAARVTTGFLFLLCNYLISQQQSYCSITHQTDRLCRLTL